MLELNTNETIKVSLNGKEIELRRPNVLDIINLNDEISVEGITTRGSYEANKRFLESIGLPSGSYDKLTVSAQTALIEYLNDSPKK